MKVSRAEAALSRAAAPLLNRCTTVCQGLCCRNIVPDTLIDTMDFVFALSLDCTLENGIARHLEKEDPLYATDCIFLKDGIGPCIFPTTLRPQVCITTFCGDDREIKKEIARVKRAFFRLEWFVRLRKWRHTAAWCIKKFRKY
jgi:hypothetical protein